MRTEKKWRKENGERRWNAVKIKNMIYMITTSSSAKAALITGLDHLGKLGKEAGSG